MSLLLTSTGSLIFIFVYAILTNLAILWFSCSQKKYLVLQSFDLLINWSLIIFQRTSSTIYINYIKWGRVGQAGTTTIDSHWKSRRNWLGTHNLIFCRGYNAHYGFFSKSTSVFNMVQGGGTLQLCCKR